MLIEAPVHIAVARLFRDGDSPLLRAMPLMSDTSIARF
jgi:hypothetical protein